METLFMEKAAVDMRPLIRSYVNSFRSLLIPMLKPEIGISSKVIPHKDGAVLEFNIVPGHKDSVDIKSIASTVNEALKRSQILINGQDPLKYKGHFRGTSIILDKNKIVLIKDSTEDEWTEEKAKQDVDRILHSA